ncbi:MAG: hypothetical protein ABI980_13000 [Nitrospirota bacterium]
MGARRLPKPIGTDRCDAAPSGRDLYLQRHSDAKMKNTAAALSVQPPTLTVVICG